MNDRSWDWMSEVKIASPISVASVMEMSVSCDVSCWAPSGGSSPVGSRDWSGASAAVWGCVLVRKGTRLCHGKTGIGRASALPPMNEDKKIFNLKLKLLKKCLLWKMTKTYLNNEKLLKNCLLSKTIETYLNNEKLPPVKNNEKYIWIYNAKLL